ncbi:hypothetical protein [Methylomonas paludis]|nr:hypothetical protein [Methylomonas paludis]
MSKAPKSNKENKKKPLLSQKEKKAEKKSKNESKNTMSDVFKDK